MVEQQGTSLMEVLIALLILSISLFAGLQQTWRSLQNFNQIQNQKEALLLLDNATEEGVENFSDHSTEKIFSLAKNCQNKPACQFSVSWRDIGQSENARKELHRQCYVC